VGAIPGVLFQWGVTAWLSFGLIGVVLLAFTVKVGSAPRPHQE
jgi:choline-glycine betaine transporter